MLAGIELSKLRTSLLRFSQELAAQRQVGTVVVMAMDGKTLRGVHGEGETRCSCCSSSGSAAGWCPIRCRADVGMAR